jgi:hypothetical protein
VRRRDDRVRVVEVSFDLSLLNTMRLLMLFAGSRRKELQVRTLVLRGINLDVDGHQPRQVVDRPPKVWAAITVAIETSAAAE